MGVSVEIFRAAIGFFNSYIQANFRVATIFCNNCFFFYIVVFWTESFLFIAFDEGERFLIAWVSCER